MAIDEIVPFLHKLNDFKFPGSQHHPLPHQQPGELTFREYEILLLIADDEDKDDIIRLTHLTPRSLTNIRNRIGDKLFLKGRNKPGFFARHNREAIRYWFTTFFPPRTT